MCSPPAFLLAHSAEVALGIRLLEARRGRCQLVIVVIMGEFLLTDADEVFRAEVRGLLGHELLPRTAAIEDDRDAVVEFVRVPGGAGYLEFTFPDLSRGLPGHPDLTHATLLRRGSLAELLRTGVRRGAAELAAEARHRIGLRGAAPDNDGRNDDQQETSMR